MIFKSTSLPESLQPLLQAVGTPEWYKLPPQAQGLIARYLARKAMLNSVK